ncbi:MAG TPA: toll/interleukin-1 receptor domain-containing protein [Candidatus Angelobacter sp.]|nr:toll/interleukin-1 receptor domain-containing protein [Candidatus Angelobacter sp.]
MDFSPLIFISHSTADSPSAVSISSSLQRAGAEVVIDQSDVLAGSDIIEFMDSGLRRADYCLLLWSRHTEGRFYSSLEWHSALAKEATLRRVFLLVGRLEAYPVPTLLRCRRYIDFFPDMQEGIEELIHLWTSDRQRAHQDERPVFPPPTAGSDSFPPSTELYLCSELFDCTIALPADLDKPAGLFLESVLSRLMLPKRISVRGRIGLDLSYGLLWNEQKLRRDQTLQEQGISSGQALILEIEAVNFQAKPSMATDSPDRRVFRSPLKTPNELLDYLNRVGLRAPWTNVQSVPTSGEVNS